MHFEKWFDWARQNLSNRSEYPQIDNEEIDMSDGFIEAWPVFGISEAGMPLLESGPPHNPNDKAERFVVLNFWYRLANWEPTLISDGLETSREAFRAHLKTLVGLRQIEACHDGKTCRWEISVACAVADWARVKALCSRWEHLDGEDYSSHHAVIGRVLVLSVYQRLVEKVQWEPSWWMPQTGIFSVGAELLSFALGLNVKLARDQLSKEEFNRICDAASEFDKASSRAGGLNPSYRSMLAWCNLAKGKQSDTRTLTLRGAEEYQKLLAKDLTWPMLNDDKVRSMIHSAVARSYEWAEELERAIEATERWIDDLPENFGTYERLAELQYKQGDYRKAFESLSREISRNPSYSQDWKSSMMIELGTRAPGQDLLSKALEKTLRPEQIEFVDALITIYWPTFEKLSDDSHRHWRDGVLFLFSNDLQIKLRDSIPEHAGFSLGKSVEVELRERIFGRFRIFVWARPALLEEARTQMVSKTLIGALACFLVQEGAWLGLGAMLSLLAFAVARRDRNRLMEEFNNWLRRYQPRVAKLTESKEWLDVKDSLSVRNDSVHKKPVIDDVIRLHGRARQLLDTITH